MVLATAGAARADDEPLPKLHLDYRVTGPAGGCPDETSFRRSVASRLGYDPFVAEEESRKLTVVVKATPPKTVTVSIRDRAGKVLGRRVIAEPPAGCEELVANAAFAASVAIDPTVLSRPEPPPAQPEGSSAAGEPEAPPARAVATVPASSDGDARAAPASPTSRWTPMLRAGATGAFGLLPSTSLGLAVGAALRAERWSAGVEGRFDLPTEDQRTIAPSGAPVTITTSLVSGNVSACGHFGRGTLVPYACAAIHAGALRGRASGIALPKEDVSPYFAFGPRLGGAVSVTPALALDVRVDVPLALTASDLRVDGRAVWTSPLAAAVLGAGAVVLLP